MKPILVTGGAGYIGSHIVRMLQRSGRSVLVVDDLSQGHAEAVGDAELIRGDFSDPSVLDDVLGRRGVRQIVHMAAFCEVGVSMREPAAYYANNVLAGLRLLDAARRHGAEDIVFSSSAAVYGEPRSVPIDEEHPKLPTNPYGETKLAFERALHWYASAYGMRYVALRYFNAGGAHSEGDLGECHDPESHLIPRLLLAARDGGDPVPLFGSDYDTEDGTCVRDFVHVEDLARAHVAAVEAMAADAVRAEAFNLGNGEGFSVLQVVDAVERVTGRRPPTRQAPRRPGDPASLVASAEKIRRRLDWQPRIPTLEQIVATAWRWHSERPDGFGHPGRAGRDG